uniref:Uncharacterized protein n=1 Tax=Tanacetum cinerariifolium TaxID=118510 RepID=A0A6L2NAV6_TANCI|nr:hypothetical protein [Tanacetum cinerariifolium]
MTPDLICPLTYQLLRSSFGDLGPDVSFDMSASPEYFSGLAFASLAEDDLNELIIKYKIPCDLHPWLPSKQFVMSELPDDAIGVYHPIFGFSIVRIPFSSFLLALIKHWKVHFSRLGPLASTGLLLSRHPDSAIDDPKPSAGSFNMEDVRRLSAHVVKLRDMPEGVLVLSRLSRVWNSRTCDPVLRGAMEMKLPFYCTLPTAVVDAVISDPTPKDLTASNLSAKVCYGPITGITTRTNLFADDSGAESDDDNDACFEILTITSIRSAAVIHSSRNQGGDSQRKGMMTDAAVAPPVGASRPRPSSSPASSFRDISGYAIHRDFSLFLLVLIMPSILMVVLLETTGAGLNDKLSLTKSLDNFHTKVARLSADLKRATILKAKKDEEILRLKANPSYRVHAELLSLAASALSMHRSKEEFDAVLKKISQFVPGAQDHEMTDGTVNAKPSSVFMQGASYAVDDAAELTLIGSEHVSSGSRDVFVALSAGEKGDGSLPSSTADEEAAAIP